MEPVGFPREQRTQTVLSAHPAAAVGALRAWQLPFPESSSVSRGVCTGSLPHPLPFPVQPRPSPEWHPKPRPPAVSYTPARAALQPQLAAAWLPRLCWPLFLLLYLMTGGGVPEV